MIRINLIWASFDLYLWGSRLLIALAFPKEKDWIEDLHSAFRVLILLNALEASYFASQRVEFGKVVGNFWEEPLQIIHHFVEGEVCDGQVSEVPIVLLALLLEFCEFGQELVFPVVFWRVFWFSLGVTSINVADEGDYIVLDVVLALELVDFQSVPEGGSEEGEGARASDDVLDHRVLPGDHEVPVPEEGESLEDPVLGLSALIVLPLLRREELVAIGQAEVLAEEAADLRLGPNPKVADHHAFLRELGIHHQATTIHRLFLKIITFLMIPIKFAPFLLQHNAPVSICKQSQYEHHAAQKKKKSLLGSSQFFFLKLRSASMKGSLGSSRRNSKFLKNLSSQESITSWRKGLQGLLMLLRLSSYSEKLLRDCSLFNVSSMMGEGGYTASIFMNPGSSDSNYSIILKFLGWRTFLFFSYLSGLKAFTQHLKIPIFQFKLLAKSKLQNSPNLSWQQQSSRVFFETPIDFAASARLIFFRPDLRLSKCIILHFLTKSIDSPIVLSLLRSFFYLFSLPDYSPDSTPLSDQLFSFQGQSFLKRIMTTRASSRQAGRRPLSCAPILARATNLLLSGSQTETLFSARGQYWLKSAERSTKGVLGGIVISIIKDWWVYSRQKTKVRASGCGLSVEKGWLDGLDFGSDYCWLIQKYIQSRGSRNKGHHLCAETGFVNLFLPFRDSHILGSGGRNELGVKTGPNSFSETVGKRGS